MNTKVQFLCRNAIDVKGSYNKCLDDFNDLINDWLLKHPCEVIDIKYSEVISNTEPIGPELISFPYTEYISAMIIYKELD